MVSIVLILSESITLTGMVGAGGGGVGPPPPPTMYASMAFHMPSHSSSSSSSYTRGEPPTSPDYHGYNLADFAVVSESSD